MVINPAFSAVSVSSCSCLIVVSATATRSRAPPVSLSISSSIHWSFSSWMKKCVSHHCSAASFFLDCKLQNAPRTRTLSASWPLLHSFAWWHCHMAHFVDLPYLPAGWGERIFFGALTIVVCVNFIVGWDVGCWKIWTIWRQAASFMSRLVC